MYLPSGEIPQFETSCTNEGGIPQCQAALSPDVCTAAFAAADCPVTSPAPALGSLAVLAVIAVLGGIGAQTLRARRARHL